MKNILIVAWFTLLAPHVLADTASPADPPNVLFIAVDDLNDWVGFLDGHPQTKTPNMDRLAARSMVFENAHCAAPVCTSSRAALLSGVAPYVSGVYGNGQTIRKSPVLKDAVMLPRYFSNHGYTAVSRGKIFHGASGKGADPESWDIHSDQRREPLEIPAEDLTDMSPYAEVRARVRFDVAKRNALMWEATQEPKELTRDYQNALWTARWLTDEAEQATPTPFFLACGIFRPHPDWVVPAEYFARFSLADTQLPPLKGDDLDDVNGAKPDDEYRYAAEHGLLQEAAWAYLANIAYADDCVGVLLDALDRSPYRDNTIVVLWSDHGWHLGEKLRYRKFTLWEEATRAPLLILAPGVAPGRTTRPVSLIDLFPTLVELAGLPPKAGLNGRSIVPLLNDPRAEWPFPALTTMAPGAHAVRTERWRYITRRGGGEELYDHHADPQEWVNLIDEPEHQERLAELKTWVPKQSAPKAPK